MEKEQSFQQMVVGQLDIHMLKPCPPKLHSYLIPYTKISPKWITDLNERVKCIKLLEETIDINLYGFGLSSHFLDMTPKSQATM